jgi:hypothetical protein
MLLRLSMLLAIVVGCGSDDRGAGGVCETSDQCGSLKCVSPRTMSTGTCQRTGTDICSDFCSTTADCAKVSAEMKCVVQCDNIGICMKP